MLSAILGSSITPVIAAAFGVAIAAALAAVLAKYADKGRATGAEMDEIRDLQEKKRRQPEEIFNTVNTIESGNGDTRQKLLAGKVTATRDWAEGEGDIAQDFGKAGKDNKAILFSLMKGAHVEQTVFDKAGSASGAPPVAGAELTGIRGAPTAPSNPAAPALPNREMADFIGSLRTANQQLGELATQAKSAGANTSAIHNPPLPSG
jgi:hypothetical protein